MYSGASLRYTERVRIEEAARGLYIGDVGEGREGNVRQGENVLGMVLKSEM